MRLAPRRVDLAAVGRECDLAVLNGGHGATAEMLLAGKPVVTIPLALEQRLMGDVVARLGAGLVAPRRRRGAIEEALDAATRDDAGDAGAWRFARRYAAFHPQLRRPAMRRRSSQLLQPPGKFDGGRTACAAGAGIAPFS